MDDPSSTHRGRSVARGCSCSLLTVLLLLIGLVAGSAASSAILVARFPDAPSDRVLEAAGHTLVASVGERPNLTPLAVADDAPICDSVPPHSRAPIEQAMALMRGTPEGETLYELLVDQRICVEMVDLAYNSGYARPVLRPNGDWSESRIAVDDSLVRSNLDDLLAALLVHEAKHMLRAVDRSACWYTDSCTILPNGVALEEEIAAHEAEARWWLAAYGDDGKRRAFGFDGGENELLAAYRDGDLAFSRWVRAYRSDPREGGDV